MHPDYTAEKLLQTGSTIHGASSAFTPDTSRCTLQGVLGGMTSLPVALLLLVLNIATQDLQCLEKVSISLLSCYNRKRKCILLGFYVIDQYKVAHNCEVDGK